MAEVHIAQHGMGSRIEVEDRSTNTHRYGLDRIQTSCMISLTPGKSIIPGRLSSVEVSTIASSNRVTSRFEVSAPHIISATTGRSPQVRPDR